jgi:HAMP domain-containing protein
MAKLADTFGDQSATLYRIGGNSFVRTAQRAGDLGVDSIKIAATYGKGGLKVLDKVGALRFAKFTARGSKMAYKGDVIHLLARLFLKVPDWVLYLLIVLGACVWVPWRWFGRLRRLATRKDTSRSLAPSDPQARICN